jgi:hypothetical protein
MRKNSIPSALFGGAALQRCDNFPLFLIPALAAEDKLTARKCFLQPVQPQR